MILMVALPLNTPPSQYRHVWLRALVCRDVTSGLIIGSRSIQFNDLLPLLNTHLATRICYNIYAIPAHTTTRSACRTATVTLFLTGDNRGDATHTEVRSIHQGGPLLIPLPPHHSTYMEPIETMVLAVAVRIHYAVCASHAW